MKKNRWLLRAGTILLIALVLMVTVSAAGIGSSDDPLVSLSYLQNTFLTQIMDSVDELLAVRNAQLTGEVNERLKEVLQGNSGTGMSSPTFMVVTLSKGQTLVGNIGCEVMLRVGTASCVSDSNPGLIDQTDGSTLNNGGELVKNHLYMMTIEGRGVKATADTVKLMVRGTYTVA